MTYIFGGFLHGHDRLLHNPYWVNNQAANTPITPNRAHPPTKRGGSDTDHGIFYYTLDQSSLSKEYFGIMNNGKLYVKESLSDLYLGQILVVFVTATDYSGRNKTISVNIEVPTFTTQATVSVDDPKRSFITSPENMPLLVGGCALFGVIAVLAAWLFNINLPCYHFGVQLILCV
jgi:hypothetical protein